jgi:hypothetical protein
MVVELLFAVAVTSPVNAARSKLTCPDVTQFAVTVVESPTTRSADRLPLAVLTR